VTPLIVVILAVMWTAVLVPPLLRSRSEGRPSNSIVDFRRQLTTLQRSAPMGLSKMPGRVGARPAGLYRTPTSTARAVPQVSLSGSYGTRSAMRRRRQNVLFTLGSIVVLSGLLGFGMHYPLMVVVNLVADVLLAGYLYLLVQLRRVEEERAMRYAWSNAA
jgi:hypothetical protein